MLMEWNLYDHELRNVFKYATMDESIARDFEGRFMSSTDWEVVDKMIKWLQGPAIISTLLCGSKYPTLTVTQLAWTKLLEHCTKSQVPDSQNTAVVVQESQASRGRACMRYLMKYEDEMKSVPARIAQFLDPRVPHYSNLLDNNIDSLFFEEILKLHYMREEDEIPQNNVEEEEHMQSIEHFLWKDIGKPASSAYGGESEVERYMKQPQENYKIDILQWWFSHKSVYPALYRMACDYLAIPSSSVCADEANSAAKITFDSRFSLHKSTFKAESCVRSWLQTLQSMKIPLPQDYHIAFDALNIDFQALAEDDEVIEYMLDDTHGHEKDAAQEV
ncbi:hypothetical protein R1sor_019263 [Riccia sorocarpa]|uniref:HAT C-terminal dimerisation domain-containing protein n=1 Tax=Riccia sorocarpa TaxID=122646 RepID=A0ABD3ICL3_9MARC